MNRSDRLGRGLHCPHICPQRERISDESPIVSRSTGILAATPARKGSSPHQISLPCLATKECPAPGCRAGYGDGSHVVPRWQEARHKGVNSLFLVFILRPLFAVSISPCTGRTPSPRVPTMRSTSVLLGALGALASLAAGVDMMDNPWPENFIRRAYAAGKALRSCFSFEGLPWFGERRIAET